MSKRLIIDANYCDRLTLGSGESVCLRLIRPSDKASMLHAFGELSQHSRHKRFFVAKQTLSEAELRYFTETDGWDHFALAAVIVHEDGTEGDGLGIARCIRFADAPECAEVAITVIDRMQGKGIGRALLERLIIAASERDIRRFRFECLAHNQEMQQLVRKVCQLAGTRSDGEIMIVEARLPEQMPTTEPATRQPSYGIYALLRAMAIQSVDLQMSLSRTVIRRTLQSPLSGIDLLRQLKRY
jgi:GNAT superfamily N-acetyltransferase